MKLTLLSLILLVVIGNALAQKETTNWYFSNNQGINFNSGAPQQTTGIPPSNIYIGDITTTCSDANGIVNFIYSGISSYLIYNRNYAVMPGASTLLNPASYSTALWAKYPGSTNKYYLFYSTQLGTTDSFYLRYAIIDMSFNAGLGQVISANTIIDSCMSRAYSIINQKGTDNFWVISNKSRTKNFHARLINASGVSTQSVISIAGLNPFSSDYFFHIMKASPNGKMLAGATYTYYPNAFGGYFNAYTEVFNFNAQTGLITNKVRTPRVAISRNLEFSPDNRLLYTLAVYVVPGLQPCGFAGSTISQYNLCYTDSMQFVKLSPTIGSNQFFCYYPVWGNMQLASDKKIYFRFTGNTMAAIKYPNRIGTSAGLVQNQFTSNAGSGESLPDFYQHEVEKPIKNNILYTGGCYPAPLSFSISNDTISNIFWNFGDPSSGILNTSTSISPNHSFSLPGIYTVTATLANTNNEFIENITELVEIKPTTRLLNNFPTDTSFCQGNSLSIQLNVINGVFEWSYAHPDYPTNIQNLGITDGIKINATGKYFVKMHQNDCSGCTMIDSINVTVKPVPSVNLGPDQTLCANDSIHIGVYDYDNNIQCVWNTGQTTDSIWVHNAGTYIVQAEISTNGCPKSDTINITVNPAVLFNLPADTTLCSGQSLLLNPNVSAATYLWQDNSTTSTFNVTTPGLYWVKVTKNGCSKRDSIVVNYVSSAQVSLGNDTTLCTGQDLALSVNIPNAVYLWNNGATSSLISATAAGQYWVRVQLNGCVATDTINILYNPIPTFTLGNDTALCENKTLVLSPNILADSYLWQNNTTNATYIVTNAGLYWLKLSKQGCTFTDSIYVNYKAAPTVFLGNDTSICFGKTLLLNAYHVNTASYLWQNGTVSASLTVSQPGLYYVDATAANGCKKRDSITINQIATPSFSLGNDTTICEGKSLTIAAPLQNNISYLWNTGAQSNAIIVSNAGLYWAELNNNNCKKRDSIIVSTKITPAVNLGADTTLCNSQELILNAFNINAGYLWQNGTIQNTYVVKNAGQFYVAVNLDNCIKNDTINVKYKYTPSFSLGEDKKLCPGNSLLLNPSIDNVNYLWQDGKTQKTYTATNTGLYVLQVSNECGIYRDSIKIEEGICNLYVPNAFTPDGNSVNDIFKVNLKDNTRSFLLQIFNRYGVMLFQSTDVSKGWDGKFKGVQQNSGAYIWTLRYVLKNSPDNVNNYKGSVLLLR